ncbi:MAG: hypothetical protein M0038_17130 [Pseudomonadota bacterium]|jgi:hypothetical protein|nr:hypothetical protein [Pseudomonadota bacterium]
MAAIPLSPVLQMLRAHAAQQALATKAAPAAAASAPATPAPTLGAGKKAPPKPSELNKILSGLNTAFGGSPTDPSHTALMGFLSALGAQSGPHMLTPVPFTQAISNAIHEAPAYQQSTAGSKITQEAALPFQKARTQEVQQAVAGQNNPNLSPLQRVGDQSLAANLVSPGMGSTLYNNNPLVVGAKTLSETISQMQKVPANVRAMILANGWKLPAQGTLPESSTQTPGGGIAQMPGGAAIMAANAANRAGGAAGATAPYQAALHPLKYQLGREQVQRLQVPGQFRPVVAGAPGAAQAAQQAAMRRMIGTEQGLTTAAQAAGLPGPFPASPQAPAPAQPPAQATGQPALPGAPPAQGAGSPVPPAPAVPGGTVLSRGETPAQLAAQGAIGQQTGSEVKVEGDEAAAARRQIALYNEMDTALAKMGPTGAWRDVTLPLAHIANYFGFKPGNITSAAQFDKYRVQLVGAATRQVSPRASTQELSYLAKQVPNYNLPGNAPRVLLSQLRGLAQYQVIRDNALTTYLEKVAPSTGGAFRGTGLGFNKWWVNNGPSPSAVVLAATLAGMPPAARSAYVGNLRKSLTGKHMIRQYLRAEAFEKQYPGVFQGL